MNTEPYSAKYRLAIIQALFELQEHEHSLSNTRKPASIDLCDSYFDGILTEIRLRGGGIFVCSQNNEFVGFICYKIESQDSIVEEDDSNHYALITDICILTKFRGTGIAKHLFDAVFEDLQVKHFSGRIRICALANNELAVQAYNRYGFKPYEVIFERSI